MENARGACNPNYLDLGIAPRCPDRTGGTVAPSARPSRRRDVLLHAPVGEAFLQRSSRSWRKSTSISVRLVFRGDESLHTEGILRCMASVGGCRVTNDGQPADAIAKVGC